jgi:hypothetical protein
MQTTALIGMLTTPRDYWLRDLEAGWGAVLAVAAKVLAVEHGCVESDVQQEIAGELLHRHAQLAIDVPLLQRLGGDAEGAVRAAILILFEQAPEWKATARTPTRRQLLTQWAPSAAHDVDLAATIDGLNAATRREVARKHCKEGKPLPPRAADDTGDLVSRRRAPPVSTVGERAGIPITTHHAQPLDDADSGAMPTPRAPSRRMLGGDGAPPHPRFRNAEAQEPFTHQEDGT